MRRIFSRIRSKGTVSPPKTPHTMERGRSKERTLAATENTQTSVSVDNSSHLKEEMSHTPDSLTESRSISPINCDYDNPSTKMSMTAVTTETSTAISVLNSSRSPEDSVSTMTSHQIIQELAFMVEPSSSSEDEYGGSDDNDNYEMYSSSSSDDDPTGEHCPVLVGCFSHLDESSLDDYIPLNQNPYGHTLKSVSAQRLAQHHLYLSTMCLAYARKLDGNTKDLRKEVSSSVLEHLLNDSALAPRDGRPYPENIWQSWNHMKKSKLDSDESPLLAEVIIRSINFHDSRYVFIVCESPNLSLTTIIIGATNQIAEKGWKSYESSGNNDTNFKFDGTWANALKDKSFLLDSIMKKVENFSDLSFVGVGDASAAAVLCGIAVASGIDTSKNTHETVSVYSFGSPKLGDSSMIPNLDFLEENDTIEIISFYNELDPGQCCRDTSIWKSLETKYFAPGHPISFSFDTCTDEIVGFWQCLKEWEFGNVPIAELPRGLPLINTKKSGRFKVWIPFMVFLLIYIPIAISMFSKPAPSPLYDEMRTSYSREFQKITTRENVRDGKTALHLEIFEESSKIQVQDKEESSAEASPKSRSGATKSPSEIIREQNNGYSGNPVLHHHLFEEFSKNIEESSAEASPKSISGPNKSPIEVILEQSDAKSENQLTNENEKSSFTMPCTTDASKEGGENLSKDKFTVSNNRNRRKVSCELESPSRVFKRQKASSLSNFLTKKKPLHVDTICFKTSIGSNKSSKRHNVFHLSRNAQSPIKGRILENSLANLSYNMIAHKRFFEVSKLEPFSLPRDPSVLNSVIEPKQFHSGNQSVLAKGNDTPYHNTSLIHDIHIYPDETEMYITEKESFPSKTNSDDFHKHFSELEDNSESLTPVLSSEAFNYLNHGHESVFDLQYFGDNNEAFEINVGLHSVRDLRFKRKFKFYSTGIPLFSNSCKTKNNSASWISKPKDVAGGTEQSGETFLSTRDIKSMDSIHVVNDASHHHSEKEKNSIEKSEDTNQDFSSSNSLSPSFAGGEIEILTPINNVDGYFVEDTSRLTVMIQNTTFHPFQFSNDSTTTGSNMKTILAQSDDESLEVIHAVNSTHLPLSLTSENPAVHNTDGFNQFLPTKLQTFIGSHLRNSIFGFRLSRELEQQLPLNLLETSKKQKSRYQHEWDMMRMKWETELRRHQLPKRHLHVKDVTIRILSEGLIHIGVKSELSSMLLSSL